MCVLDLRFASLFLVSYLLGGTGKDSREHRLGKVKRQIRRTLGRRDVKQRYALDRGHEDRVELVESAARWRVGLSSEPQAASL
jgi:hypothetical protein